MGRLRSSLRRVAGVIQRKLGVCPYCMRASALGAVVGWILYLASALLSSWLLSLLVLLAASAFTLLIAAHLVAYMVRVGLHLRHRDRMTRPASGGLARREFLGLILKAGAYALAVALLPSARLFAQAGACQKQDGTPKSHDVATKPPTFTETAMFISPLTAAEEEVLKQARAKCKAVCDAKACDAAQGTTCVALEPVRGPLTCKESQDQPGFFRCSTEVKQCPCKCYTCQDNTPPAPYNEAYGEESGVGTGDEGPNMEADGKAKCDEFCKKIKCPPPPADRVCKQNPNKNPNYGKRKTGRNQHSNKRYSRAPITKCQCICA